MEIFINPTFTKRYFGIEQGIKINTLTNQQQQDKHIIIIGFKVRATKEQMGKSNENLKLHAKSGNDPITKWHNRV